MKKNIVIAMFLLIAASISASVQSPVEYTVCKDSTLLLSSSYSGAARYEWSTGDTTISIRVNTSMVDTLDLSVRAFLMRDSFYLSENLMTNGGFEDGYNGFSVDATGDKPLKPITKNGTPVIDPYHVYSKNYDNGDDYGHYYMISSDASRVQDGVNCKFYPIKAHGGRYFYIADASSSGYVWKAQTSNNPNLKLEKDSFYVFSCWYAYPNMGKELSDPVAELQFKLEYTDADFGYTVKKTLGGVCKVKVDGDLYSWHQHTVVFQATGNSSNVTIGVMNLTNSTEGNDFCLDDIMFQKRSNKNEKMVSEQEFRVYVEDCDTPCPDVIKDRVDTVVCSSEMPFTWRGYEYTVAATRFWVEKSARGCDSIDHRWHLSTKDCSIPCPELQTITTTEILCDTMLQNYGFIWRGKTFTEIGTYSDTIYSDRGCDSICFVLKLDTVICLPEQKDTCIGEPIYRKWGDVLLVRDTLDEYRSYQWYRDSVLVQGANLQYFQELEPDGVAAHEYYVVITKRDGTSLHSCPQTFNDTERSADHNPAKSRQLVAKRVFMVGANFVIEELIYDNGDVDATKRIVK